MQPRWFWVATSLLILSGCGTTSQPAATAAPLSGSISVLAAASLTVAFQSAATNFEKAHAGTTVQSSFAGSSTLVAQIKQGAPADLFASADQANVQKLVDANLVSGSPQVFARNKLQIIVAARNPKGISGLVDLGKSGLVVVLCAPAVPCGNYAGQALARAGVTVKAASQEQDVKAVVSKVALGEADAGIVYVTDVKAGGSKVLGVDIPDSQNVVASYPIAILKGAQNPKLARAFLDYLVSPAGQRSLAGYGFARP